MSKSKTERQLSNASSRKLVLVSVGIGAQNISFFVNGFVGPDGKVRVPYSWLPTNADKVFGAYAN